MGGQRKRIARNLRVGQQKIVRSLRRVPFGDSLLKAANVQDSLDLSEETPSESVREIEVQPHHTLLKRQLATFALPVLHVAVPAVVELETILKNLQTHFTEVAGEDGRKLLDLLTYRSTTTVTIQHKSEISES